MERSLKWPFAEEIAVGYISGQLPGSNTLLKCPSPVPIQRRVQQTLVISILNLMPSHLSQLKICCCLGAAGTSAFSQLWPDEIHCAVGANAVYCCFDCCKFHFSHNKHIVTMALLYTVGYEFNLLL